MLAGLAVAIATVAAIALWWQQVGSRINRENLFRLRDGMTLAEATAILGPPGDYRSGATESCDRRDPFGSTFQTVIGNRIESNDRRVVWDTDSARVIVTFDVSDQLVGGSLISMQKTKVSLVENVRWRAKRLWDKWFPS
jgi:hypothetical protein